MPKIKVTSSQLVTASEIRSNFAKAMSDMYRFEVPMYGTLIDMVQQINQQELDSNPELRQSLEQSEALQRISAERHGAIRLGTAEELFTMRRLFAVMGMYPVSYYDLTEAGIPVHSTAFRPLQIDELNKNPFRVFTSLLRLDLITDETLRFLAKSLLSRRQIFTEGLITLIETSENNNGLNAVQAQQFVAESLQTFRWHHQSTVNLKTYQEFLKTHRLVADIVCFKGPHINHLTPRTLNIDIAQQQMESYGLQAKAIIEGPPKRRNPILLRQTSFKALDEEIQFVGDNSETEQGSHTARFGEIEQRGMALTAKGRTLYDRLLNEVRQACPDAINNIEHYYRTLEQIFQQFPDDLLNIHNNRLGFFIYTLNPDKEAEEFSSLNELVKDEALDIYPITYEDFLPVSAAGIFQSNLDERETQTFSRSPNQQAFENDLGSKVMSEFEYYAKIQADSLLACLQQLNLDQDQQQILLDQLNTVNH
ncbi:MAG: VOC family protein [Gammaproteobacteria bacterium]|nr:VOC family protein [Gammaproteobacteria bacterium]